MLPIFKTAPSGIRVTAARSRAELNDPTRRLPAIPMIVVILLSQKMVKVD
jgi:hypothetical protein